MPICLHFQVLHKPPVRMSADAPVSAGAYIRVHTVQRTFPEIHNIDWVSRIITHGSEFLVVNKPSGVQCMPTVDNSQDCLTTAVQRALRLETLLNTHRLDEGTEGVLVLAKTRGFARYFQMLLAHNHKDGSSDRSIRKVYRCATLQPPPLGVLEHFMLQGTRYKGSPKYTAVAQAGAQRAAHCKLEIISVDTIQVRDFNSQSHEKAYEATILLYTGRTHQIRAQLAAVGCPLLGDSLYIALHDLDALHCGACTGGGEPSVCSDDAEASVPPASSNSSSSESGPANSSSSGDGCSNLSWREMLRENGCSSSVALQAFRISITDAAEGDQWFGGASVEFEAGSPRWRDIG